MFVQTLHEASRRTWLAKLAITKAVAIPVILSWMLELAASQSDSGGVALASGIVSVILAIFVAINVHRILLLGESSVPQWGRIAFGKIEREFLIYTLGYSFVLIGLALVLTGLTTLVEPFGGVLAFVAMLAFALIACRLSIIFPSIAVGETVSIHWVWKNTEGKTGALFLLLGVVPVLVGALTHFISLLGLFFIDMILGYVVMVYFVAVLSVAYELIAGENKHDDSEPKDDMTIEL